jgi:hypothetical protein
MRGIKPFQFIQPLLSTVRTNLKESLRRLKAALASTNAYYAGNHLLELVTQIGGECEAGTRFFLQENNILEVKQVWELEEAHRLRGEIERRVREARRRIEEETNA